MAARRAKRLVGAGIAAALLAGGCAQERTFTAEELVDGVNEMGVELRLGEPLLTEDPDKELYAVELEPLAAGEGNGSGGGHSGGSLAVYDDSDGADVGIRACEASADLLCYRVANIVIVLEQGGIEAQRLGVAMQRIAEEEG